MGATHFRLRTLEKVSAEMSLHVLAYNLKRMIAILGVQPLIQAMRAALKPYIVGWRGYFGFCQTPRVLTNLEALIRRRLRLYLWRQWRASNAASKNYAIVVYRSSMVSEGRCREASPYLNQSQDL
jgi:hypothetical protein